MLSGVEQVGETDSMTEVEFGRDFGLGVRLWRVCWASCLRNAGLRRFGDMLEGNINGGAM